MQDQIVSVIATTSGFAVLLTIPVGANDSITTVINTFDSVEAAPSASRTEAHMAAASLFAALTEHNRVRTTKFASDDETYVRTTFISDRLVSALVPISDKTTLAAKAFGFVRASA